MPKSSVLRWSPITVSEAADLKLIVSQRDFRCLSPGAEPGYYRGSDGRNAITVRVVADELAA